MKVFSYRRANYIAIAIYIHYAPLEGERDAFFLPKEIQKKDAVLIADNV